MIKLLTAILLALCLTGCSPAFASPEFTEANIIKALAGEAGGQSMKEIIAHAHAIANRGHLRGVYGFGAKVSPEAVKRAKEGYLASLITPDTVNGSDHWLSEYDLKHSRPALIAWRHKAVYSVMVGETVFYRLK